MWDTTEFSDKIKKLYFHLTFGTKENSEISIEGELTAFLAGSGSFLVYCSFFFSEKMKSAWKDTIFNLSRFFWRIAA